MIAIGKIVKTVGLKGELKVYPYAADPSFYEGCTLYIDGDPHVLSSLRFQKGMAFVQLQGIADIEGAERMVQREIFMRRADIALEEDEYFHADLIGLKVFDAEDRFLGVVREILSPSSQDLLVVEGEREIFIPIVDAFVLDIDLKEKRIRVRLMEGL